MECSCFKVSGFPDHVVMIVVCADEAAAYLNKYKLFREGPDRRVLAVSVK